MVVLEVTCRLVSSSPASIASNRRFEAPIGFADSMSLRNPAFLPLSRRYARLSTRVSPRCFRPACSIAVDSFVPLAGFLDGLRQFVGISPGLLVVGFASSKTEVFSDTLPGLESRLKIFSGLLLQDLGSDLPREVIS